MLYYFSLEVSKSEVCLTGAGQLVNNVNSDHTAPADQGLHCLSRHVRSNTKDHYSIHLRATSQENLSSMFPTW